MQSNFENMFQRRFELLVNHIHKSASERQDMLGK